MTLESNSDVSTEALLAVLEVMVVTSIEKQNIPILMYHSISTPASSGFQACTVSQEVFDEHLSYLKQRHYTSVTVTQLAKAMAKGGSGLPPRPVILTFDDGYADFYTVALPALQRHGFTATLYVTTAFIGSTSRWLRYVNERSRPMLTTSQLTEINACGIECGAHSHTHPPLDMLPPRIARDEIMHSKELLEDCLGHQVLSFAYPYGYHSTRLQQIVRTCGFTSACAIKRAVSSLHDNPYALARLAIIPDTSVDELDTALVTGRGPLVASPIKRTRTRVRQFLRSAFRTLWPGWSAIDMNARMEMRQM